MITRQRHFSDVEWPRAQRSAFGASKPAASSSEVLRHRFVLPGLTACDITGGCSVPEISRFLGIVIGMFFNEHGVAHFHAGSQDHSRDLVGERLMLPHKLVKPATQPKSRSVIVKDRRP